MTTHYTWGRICVFCRTSFTAPDDDGWTTHQLGRDYYWRCPSCTAANRTEPLRGEDDTP